MATAAVIKNDARIQQDVLNELKWDPRVNETEIGVEASDGVVRLTGMVQSYAARLAAREAAHRVSGVLDVADDVEVRVPGGLRSDSDIAKAVRHSLEWDVFIPDRQIRSTVSGGWVTLDGTVNRLTEREDAARAVERLLGVRGVTNLLTVSPSASITDGVCQAVEAAMERRTERAAKRITISVNDGIVALSGPVRTWSEKEAIRGAAAYAPGIRGVEDHLVVEPSP